MAWSTSDMPSQTGRVALVTGSNAGLGLATAKALAAKGAKVLLACRNAAKAEAAADEVRAVATGDVEVLSLDLSSLASVAACAKGVLDREDRLDLLINNAGLMAVDQERTEDGFEMQIGVNHLGHFALDAHLLPLVSAAAAARRECAATRPGPTTTGATSLVPAAMSGTTIRSPASREPPRVAVTGHPSHSSSGRADSARTCHGCDAGPRRAAIPARNCEKDRSCDGAMRA